MCIFVGRCKDVNANTTLFSPVLAATHNVDTQVVADALSEMEADGTCAPHVSLRLYADNKTCL